MQLITLSQSKELPMISTMFKIAATLPDLILMSSSPDIDIIFITSDFIKNVIKEENLDYTSNLLKEITRGSKKIFIVGKNNKYVVEGFVSVDADWRILEDLLKIVEKSHLYKESAISNVTDHLIEKFIDNSSSSDELIRYVNAEPDKAMMALSKILEIYSQKDGRILELITSLEAHSVARDIMEKENQKLKESIEKRTIENDIIKSEYNRLVTEINKRNPNFDSALKPLSPIVLNFSKVLYFKEYSSVRFTTSLIGMIKKLLKVKNISSRIVIIESSNSHIRSKDKYKEFILHNELSIEDLKSEDIVMLGFQKDILKAIIQNLSSFNVLIIFDRTKSDEYYIKHPDIEYIGVSNDKDGIIEDTIISYTKPDLIIPYKEGFDEESSMKQMSIYSGFEVVDYIINNIVGG